MPIKTYRRRVRFSFDVIAESAVQLGRFMASAASYRTRTWTPLRHPPLRDGQTRCKWSATYEAVGVWKDDAQTKIDKIKSLCDPPVHAIEVNIHTPKVEAWPRPFCEVLRAAMRTTSRGALVKLEGCEQDVHPTVTMYRHTLSRLGFEVQYALAELAVPLDVPRVWGELEIAQACKGFATAFPDAECVDHA